MTCGRRRYAALVALVKAGPRETRGAAHPNPQNIVSVLVDVDEPGTPTAAKVQFATPPAAMPRWRPRSSRVLAPR